MPLAALYGPSRRRLPAHSRPIAAPPAGPARAFLWTAGTDAAPSHAGGVVGQRVVPLRHRSLQLWLLVGVPRSVRGLMACRGAPFATGPVPTGPYPGGCGELETADPGDPAGRDPFARVAGPAAEVLRVLPGRGCGRIPDSVETLFQRAVRQP